MGEMTSGRKRRNKKRRKREICGGGKGLLEEGRKTRKGFNARREQKKSIRRKN